MVHQAEGHVGTTPSDEDWLLISSEGLLMGEPAGKAGDHREAALLHIRSLQYADTNKRVADSYRSLGFELEKLDLLDAAEYCYRLTVRLAPGGDFGRTWLADVLVKQKKYAEAETIYREMLPRATTAEDRVTLNADLAGIAKATGRKEEADNYEKESRKAWKEMK
ncbi:MAG TPA: hypothetical protein VHY84_03330 [Bryobacteraceae bacterium]|jgi:tetratricopeptide (TPR) repeat protein|nr:hypothetical protein [Bryobacteraceae bacterium]